MIFLKRAGTIILGIDDPALGAASFPQAKPGESQIDGSIAGKIATGIEVVVRPIGFNHDIALALLPAMAAREVAVAALATVYSIDAERRGSSRAPLAERLRGRWSLPTALAFLAWFVFAPQCISTIAVTRRETNGWKWPLFMVGYLFALAYVAAGATYWTAIALGFSGSPSTKESDMAGVNKVILVGNLGDDPEARSLNNGGEVVNLRVATSENWKDRDGNRQERTEWHHVVIFNENLGRVAKSYLRKGSKVYLEGQIQTRKWKDQSGDDRYSTEIVLQRFRGELVLLDAAVAAAAAAASAARIGERLRRLGSAGAPPAAPAAGGVRQRPRRRRAVLEPSRSLLRFSLARAANGPASASESTPASLRTASAPALRG